MKKKFLKNIGLKLNFSSSPLLLTYFISDFSPVFGIQFDMMRKKNKKKEKK